MGIHLTTVNVGDTDYTAVRAGSEYLTNCRRYTLSMYTCSSDKQGCRYLTKSFSLFCKIIDVCCCFAEISSLTMLLVLAGANWRAMSDEDQWSVMCYNHTHRGDPLYTGHDSKFMGSGCIVWDIRSSGNAHPFIELGQRKFSMSSPNKIRKLPAWAGRSIPPHAQATGTESAKDICQEQQSARSQSKSEDVAENFSSPNVADVPESVEIGTRRPVQDLSKVMEGVIFTISGIVNPERTELRKLGIDMGAQYRPTWSVDSTLLVCPFPNTLTFKQVKASGGTIVHKDWMTKCYHEKGLVAIEPYLLNVGNPWKTGSTDEDSHDFGVANDFPGSCVTVQQKSAVQCNRESQTVIPRTELSKQPGSPGGAGMEYQANNAGGLKNVASPVDVQQWVLEDLAATLTWLEQQNDKPEEHELEAVAAQGLLVCLGDAVRSLQENQGLSMVMDNWAFIPRAVRELAVYEKGGQAIKDQLIAEGERFKVIYESQLKKLGFGFPSSRNYESSATTIDKDESNSMAKNLKPGFVDEAEKDVDDDATEIISDTDSRDPVDFDSDDTEELAEDEIALCKEKILETFRLD